MNFYMANSMGDIRREDYNVELDDDLLDYIYSLKNKIQFSALYNIDPYDDIEIEKEAIMDIISSCKCILEMKLLKDYDDEVNGTIALNSLIKMSEKAITEGKKMISVGD